MSKKRKPAWQKGSRSDDDVDKLTYAGEQVFRYLYRYLPFHMEKPKPHWDSGPEMLKDILINRRIRASNPKKFNDPWDCKPCIDPVLLEDHQTRRAMAESLIATQKGGPKGDITDYRLLTDPEFLKKNVSRFNDFMEGFI